MGTAHINFYGGSYLYRFINENDNAFVFDPYLFVGFGLITSTDGYDGESKGSFFSYGAGGGLEIFVTGRLGVSAEIGYGKLNVSNGVGVAGIIGGGGIHY